MYRFGLIGAAGYIAPRHMKAIRDNGHQLVATLDPYDGMGQIDAYFPEADFFTEPERFDRHLDKLRRDEQKRIHFVSICSPNYLHDAHIRMALRNDADAICEKPLVLNPWNVDALSLLEEESGRKIHVILQLRLHPLIESLREKVRKAPPGKVFDVDLRYITPRGRWYQWSWKGKPEKSGGVATNIGIHLFDMLLDVFGSCREMQLHYQDAETASGFLALEKANVRWFLSLSPQYLTEASEGNLKPYRAIQVDEEAYEFSGGFEDLHTLSYAHILEGKGFSTADARASVDLVYQIRNATAKWNDQIHPLLHRL